MPKLKTYIALLRLDKPVGILLLLWPTLCALWIASRGLPDLKILLIFILGTILMRSAGCIINDYADRNFDPLVARTKSRPLATGSVSLLEAFCLLMLCCLLALVLVLQLNTKTLFLAMLGLLITLIYPFSKRFFPVPQAILGASFAMSIPMAFVATENSIPLEGWILFTAGFLWPLAYDTIYAMVDKPDDVKINIHSAAIFFNNYEILFVGSIQILFLLTLILLGIQLHFTWPYFVSLIIIFGLMIYQQKLISTRQSKQCFRAFLNNQWVGLIIFVGVLTQYLVNF